MKGFYRMSKKFSTVSKIGKKVSFFRKDNFSLKIILWTCRVHFWYPWQKTFARWLNIFWLNVRKIWKWYFSSRKKVFSSYPYGHKKWRFGISAATFCQEATKALSRPESNYKRCIFLQQTSLKRSFGRARSKFDNPAVFFSPRFRWIYSQGPKLLGQTVCFLQTFPLHTWKAALTTLLRNFWQKPVNFLLNVRK